MQNLKVSHDNLPEATSQILETVKNLQSTLSKLEETSKNAIPEDPEPYIYGIKGLAAFLKVSTPTAQKIKNSGRVPFSQAERTIVFRKSDVLRALLSKNKGGKKL